MKKLDKYYPFKLAGGGRLEDALPMMDDTNVIAEEKYDGIRCHIHIDGKNSKAYTRVMGKNSKEFGDKTKQVQHIIDDLSLVYPPGTVIDGEIVLPRACKVVTKSKLVSTALADADAYGPVELVVYDVIIYGGVEMREMGLEDRREHIVFSKYSFCSMGTVEKKREFLSAIWRRGGEGIILKPLDGLYITKGRKGWTKVKKKAQYDVVFMGIEMAKETSKKSGASEATKTKFAGQAGAIIVGQFVTPEMYKSNPNSSDVFLPVKVDGKKCVYGLTDLGTVSGMDDALRKDITKNHTKYFGRVLTIECQEREPTGAFRHGVFKGFRDDKSFHDCVYRADEA